MIEKKIYFENGDCFNMIEDDLFFYILGKMKSFGHPEAPLQIIKKKHTFIVGHKTKNYFDEREILEEAFKIVHIKGRDIWKLFWEKSNLKWHLYGEYGDLGRLLEEVEQDPNGCFWE